MNFASFAAQRFGLHSGNYPTFTLEGSGKQLLHGYALELICGQALKLYRETPGDYGVRTLQYITLMDNGGEVCHDCENGSILADLSERNYPCSSMTCCRLGSRAGNAADSAAFTGAISALEDNPGKAGVELARQIINRRRVDSPNFLAQVEFSVRSLESKNLGADVIEQRYDGIRFSLYLQMFSN